MRGRLRFLSTVVALILSAACAPSGAPSGSDAGGAATGVATTTAPATVPSPPANPLGVVEEGALADLLLVDGNPIADIKLVTDPAKNFVLIMKDGKIYKNTLSH